MLRVWEKVPNSQHYLFYSFQDGRNDLPSHSSTSYSDIEKDHYWFFN